MQNTQNTDPLYSTDQAAEYLNQDSRTLANQRCNREGPNYVRLGRLIRYKKSALDSYIDTAEINLGS